MSDDWVARIAGVPQSQLSPVSAEQRFDSAGGHGESFPCCAMTDQNTTQRLAELESTVQAQQATIAELEARIDELETTNDALEATNEELEATNNELEATIQEVEATNEELEATNETLRERIAHLESQPEITVADESDPIGSLHIAGAPVGQAITSKPGQSDLDAELDALREELESVADHDEPVEPTVEPQTPLEQIVALPGAVAEEQLTANQRRARFVAKDITEYASKTPAGWVLTPKDLRTVLNAAFDTSHSQTCSRVRTILADLGDEAVSITDSRGEKKTVFDVELVGRLLEIDTADHDVVSHSEG